MVMVKRKVQQQDNIGSQSQEKHKPTTLADLKAHPDIWYKIQVFLHDLTNLSRNPTSETRTLCTTAELYMSAPYFTSEEAALIKATKVEQAKANKYETIDEVTETEEPTQLASTNNIEGSSSTIEEQIKLQLAYFFEKRRASGDSIPCGTHDMAPFYRGGFGIESDELKDERFLGRLRRAGLACDATSNDKAKGKAGKKKKG